jgi:hypothetical protein
MTLKTPISIPRKLPCATSVIPYKLSDEQSGGVEQDTRGKSMAVAYPVIGHWYRRSNGSLFEVVAVDEEDGTVELQFFDGTIDEVDLESWPDLLIESVGAPEDWSGSVDMDPEDYLGEDNGELPLGWHDPLEMLDKAD